MRKSCFCATDDRNCTVSGSDKSEIPIAEFNEEVQRHDDSILEVCRNVALSADDC